MTEAPPGFIDADVADVDPDLFCEICGFGPAKSRAGMSAHLRSHGGGETAPKGAKKPGNKRIYVGYSALLSGAGVAAMMVDPISGHAIINGAENLALALQHLGDANPKARKQLEMLLSAGVYAEVGVAVVAIIYPIAVGHGVLPDNIIPTTQGVPQ